MNIDAINQCVSQLQMCSFFLGICLMLLVVLISVYFVKLDRIKKMKEFEKKTGVDMEKLKTMLGAGSSTSVSSSDNIE